MEIIGEAVKQIPDEFRSVYPLVEWRKMAGTRDKLIHDYLWVDFLWVNPHLWWGTPRV